MLLIMGIENMYTSTYHPQTNGQTKRYNRKIMPMRRLYVSYHQRDWDQYILVLELAYIRQLMAERELIN